MLVYKIESAFLGFMCFILHTHNTLRSHEWNDTYGTERSLSVITITIITKLFLKTEN